ncbi:MAG TPA: ChbG/HpnK family deacetylase [Nitrososphaera sp.]|jgi:predicted glycoside hydrolase/deacetylase ChbG (UPF0249 family)
MLIVNADDYGKNTTVTDNTLKCFLRGLVTSASAMVFMADSKRAAVLAKEYGLETGLHLNFTLMFDGVANSGRLIESQRRIASFLKMGKYASLFYHPTLRMDFETVYEEQCKEYLRLYGKEPTHIDGHHHMHLCTNMLVSKLIPEGTKVRRSFCGLLSKRGVFNRSYRHIVDSIVEARYKSTDMFFSVTPPEDIDRAQKIIALSQANNVELMVHPERSEDMDLLMSDQFSMLIDQTKIGSYASLF